ncbi:unnamed protein product [Darwinula stevensoni]|uniref:All-trans-retinol 13,14-reductase n=1 Tax=Darwinula stevensoni TaxID=69355 RepID=A0A7R8X691_9CRUS|nr:unnamed protein product [Darwinula stevensoni]CAG0887367.1 unnamed protein product [Darwinula stevensoni]
MLSLWSLTLGGLVILLFKFLQSLLFNKKRSDRPIFSLADVRPLAPHVANQKLRDKVLKQGFSSDEVPHDLDAIVIGSGIGGLSAAALLAKAGKKVLVLEQHDQSANVGFDYFLLQAGGSCHTFIEKGYEFDVGIHYVGGFEKAEHNRVLFDQLTDGQLEFARTDPVNDVVKLRYLSDKKATYEFCCPKDRWISTLKKEFPGEEEAIDNFVGYISEAKRGTIAMGVVKFLPLWLAKIVIKLGVIDWFIPYTKWASRSIQSVLEELTDNKDLRAAFTYIFGDFGVLPSEAGFNLLALLHDHFYEGAYYPRGGASEIAFHIIPVIEKSGGKVLVRANVKEILLDESGTRAMGVVVQKGSGSVNVTAPIVISSTSRFTCINSFFVFSADNISFVQYRQLLGVKVTLTKLLPEEVGKRAIQYPVLSRVRQSFACFQVFLGLNASNEELKLTAQNYWCFIDNNLEEASVHVLLCLAYNRKTAEEALDADIPLMFVSFPSAKDPTHDQRYPGKATCALITFFEYEWFRSWEKENLNHRGDRYEEIKKTIGQRLIDQACKLFPQIQDKIDLVVIGSPLSHNYYLGNTVGDIYGLHHDMERFKLETQAILRPETGIPGLYLSGQDVMSCGLTGAVFGGVFCASKILERNLMNELDKLAKEAKRREGKSQEAKASKGERNGAVMNGLHG